MMSDVTTPKADIDRKKQRQSWIPRLDGRPYGRVVHLVFGVGGFAMLTWMIGEIGVRPLIDVLRPVGVVGVALVVATFGLAQLPSCVGWRLLMPAGARFDGIFRAYVIGDALNLTVPSADTAGEIAKVMMLRHRIPWRSVAASVTLHRMLELVALVALIGAGVVVSLARVPLPGWWHATGIAMSIATLVVVAGFFLAERRSGVYGPLLEGVSRRMGARSEVGNSIDRELRAALAQKSRVAVAGGLVLFSWGACVAEVYLSLWLLSLPARWDLAVVIEAFSVVASNAAFFVPGRLGVSDGGRVLLLTTLGIDPPGALAFAVLRRARELAWAGVGFGLLFVHRQSPMSRRRGVAGPVHRQMETN